MDFDYFTLSDNRYTNNTRTPEEFIGEDRHHMRQYLRSHSSAMIADMPTADQ